MARTIIYCLRFLVSLPYSGLKWIVFINDFTNGIRLFDVPVIILEGDHPYHKLWDFGLMRRSPGNRYNVFCNIWVRLEKI